MIDKKLYDSRLVTMDEAIDEALFPHANVVLGGGVATPDAFTEAIYRKRETIPFFNLFTVIYFGNCEHLRPEMRGKIRPVVNFMEAQARKAYAEGLLDFIPCHFHEVPSLFREGYFPVDIAVVHVSLPDENGLCSFGLACDYTKPAADNAKVIIAELNPHMPRVGGAENTIHIKDIDYIVEVNRPIRTVPQAEVGEIEKRIGQYCASLVKDGATLQLGIGAIPDAVLFNLEDRKDLGIHTEMFSDGVMNLVQKGVVTGNCKNIEKSKVVTAFITGTKDLYDFVNDNPDILLKPVDFTNDPYIIGQIDNFVSINSAIEIDLYGQVTAESIGYRLFSGSGGQVDFLRGVKRSKGGISIIALPSTAAKGRVSRIVPCLQEGSIVTSGRNEVDYIVTEYGIAKLKGKTMSERAKALIDIAHPDFREDLIKAAKNMIGYFA